ncbi:MAG: hypoxanthine-guanine phosphoribosyltransferase [Desulfuromonadaceae bacterium]|nr:hypoxanthine-guanine phosphoribosyltransferase [Desulfuromonadaceae bacterium]MDD2849960.1 hypoxanthine-guanine phosphoribosyltransferase [Desulfuromonadaceae bacterium]MDD4131201.1 hypoxanthine-guanine phosphoribosyltransferase [Desulfuromonadaceae bacterium]
MNITEANKVMGEADLLVTEAEVVAAILRVAEEITNELKNSNPVFICCMNGGLVFSGQLLTKLVFPLQVDYVHATRYGHEINGVALDWKVRPQLNLQGRTVVLLDDILDEGVTLASIAEYCRQQGASKIMMAVLIEKLHLRKVTPGMRADFTGIEVGDRFLFGYGLDYKGYWRNAPGVYALKGH